jgi:hypothetical protein
LKKSAGLRVEEQHCRHNVGFRRTIICDSTASLKWKVPGSEVGEQRCRAVALIVAGRRPAFAGLDRQAGGALSSA